MTKTMAEQFKAWADAFDWPDRDSTSRVIAEAFRIGGGAIAMRESTRFPGTPIIRFPDGSETAEDLLGDLLVPAQEEMQAEAAQAA
jgi:hypothetical protein